jgi:hypothetical protein
MSDFWRGNCGKPDGRFYPAAFVKSPTFIPAHAGEMSDLGFLLVHIQVRLPAFVERADEMANERNMIGPHDFS